MTTNEQAYNTNAGFWVQIIREDRDRYRKGLTDPAILDAIGETHGLAVLDAGCGEGYMSRSLAGNGAKVTGMDISAELIKAAKAHQLSDGLPVTFDVGSVDSLPYDVGTFDLVLCNHLLNDLEDPARAIREFARVLCEDGRIVILMLHPCFYNKRAERDQPANNLLTATYFQAPQRQPELRGRRAPVTGSDHRMASAAGVLCQRPARVRIRDHEPQRTAPVRAAAPQ